MASKKNGSKNGNSIAAIRTNHKTMTMVKLPGKPLTKVDRSREKTKLNKDLRLSPFSSEGKSNAIVLDTNVIIVDPNSLNVAREGGNILYLPIQVLMELDGLKNKPDVGIDAREAIRIIEDIQKSEENSKHKSLRVIRDENWEDLKGLDKDKPDNKIIAATNYVLKNHKNEFRKIKFLSRDRMVRILSSEYWTNGDLLVEDYNHDKVSDIYKDSQLSNISVPSEIIKTRVVPKRHFSDFYFEADSLNPRDKKLIDSLPENSGVVCYSDWDGNFNMGPEYKSQLVAKKKKNAKFDATFITVKKGGVMKIIDKDITAFGVKQYSINGNGVNWNQLLALDLLLDKKVEAVFLRGGAGTGKTILAVASALEQIEKEPGSGGYKKILITRPQVHLENRDNMGFLPGNQNKKMDPWMTPIWQALEEIKELSLTKLTKKFSNNSKDSIEDLKAKNKIITLSLDYIRGQSIKDAFVIVDEAQNLTLHQIKTIITRMAGHSKIVFTGDLGQIDRFYLDRKSSGLAHASERLAGINGWPDTLPNSVKREFADCSKLIGVVNFTDSVRSVLASFAEKVL